MPEVRRATDCLFGIPPEGRDSDAMFSSINTNAIPPQENARERHAKHPHAATTHQPSPINVFAFSFARAALYNTYASETFSPTLGAESHIETCHKAGRCS